MFPSLYKEANLVVFQALRHVQLYATPWTAARQTSLSFTISQSLLKLIFTEEQCKDQPLSLQVSSVPQSCLTLCDPMDCSILGFPVHYQLLELPQTHVLWVGNAIQPSHPLLSPSPPAFNLSQHQGLFQWVSSLHEVAKVLELQLQHQS